MFQSAGWMEGFTLFDAACLELEFDGSDWHVTAANQHFVHINRIDTENTPVERWHYRAREYFKNYPAAAGQIRKVVETGSPTRLILPIGDFTPLTDWLVIPVAPRRIGLCGLPEDSILSAKKLYHDFFRKSSDPFLILQGEQFQDCNDAALELLGFDSREQLFGKTPWELSPVEQPDGTPSNIKAQQMIETAYRQGHLRFEWVHLNHSGEELYLDIQLTVCDDEGASRMFVVWRDISRRKKLEQELVSEQQRFRYALQATKDAVWDWDVTGGTAYFSDRYYTMLGYRPGEFPADFAEWRRLVHPDDLDSVTTGIKEHLKNRSPGYEIEFRLRMKEGGYKWILGRGLVVERDPAGNALRMVGTHTDIDQRKINEELIRSHRERLMTTLNSIADGVIGVNAEGCIETINPAACRITATAREDAAGRPITALLPLDQLPADWNAWKNCFLDNGRAGDARICKPVQENSKPVFLRITASPLTAASDAQQGAVFVLQDITRERELNEQLEHARKMEVIGQLAGGVAHDFNNMLTGIRGAAELAEAQCRRDGAHPQYMDVIIQTVDRAADLTRKLLDFSRKGKLFSTPIDLHDSIRRALELLERSVDPRIEIKSYLNAAVPVVVGDPTQLENALLNLGLNARDALPEGGEIIYATANQRLSRERCRDLELEESEGDYLTVTVKDNGTGIQEKHLKHIFDPFFTTKEVGKGTGLGLAAVYGMVKGMHGAVDVFSHPDEGTEIILYLPVESGVKPQTTPVVEVVPDRWQGRVLLVEDEQVVRTTAVRMLQMLGFEVDTAADGLEAVNKASAGNYDLAVLDLVMPKLHGKDAFVRLKELDPQLPVLIVSGFTMNQTVHDLIAQGAAGFMAKPYSMADLQMWLHRLVPVLYRPH